MTPRPFGCDGNDCDYDVGGWFHIDCALASRAASEIRHPAMTPTRAHFKATPLPTQADRWSV